MKVMTVLGTRPEIIRLSRVIALLDAHTSHVLVHTGQNYDDRLNGLFFRELDVRAPDVLMNIRATGFGQQAGEILAGIEPILLEHRPDRLLILGDTNSGLTAVVARRLGIPVFHMEAGNRCYDDRVPEEINRRVIDHCSSVLMPYTCRSRENLLREGFEGQRIYVIGNPIYQVIKDHEIAIGASRCLEDLGVEAGRFFLVTMHRAENVDREDKLQELVEALARLHERYGYPVICSFHPRTRAKVEKFGVDIERKGVRLVEPLGFIDFIRLERSAFCILSDSGTVQEEACIFGVPNVTIREVTERPETLDCGSNVLSGSAPDDILRHVSLVTAQSTAWQPPAEYLAPLVAEAVLRIVTGFRRGDAAEYEWQHRLRV
ncbi:MAG: UDP-N-acetylglucosamine 2-epimerase (non-hydrolyzing) [Acidobacteriota bacterium]